MPPPHDDIDIVDLTEPLLLQHEQEQQEQFCLPHNNDDDNNNNHDIVQDPPRDGASSSTAAAAAAAADAAAASDDDDTNVDFFWFREELLEMWYLGWPLAISFFCRMAMASTDSAFVGHVNDEHYSAQVYLAAATLSDMCVNIFITPPLAFNQVLNALVGQAMGSQNPRMAGIWLQQSIFWLTITMIPCLTGIFYVEPMLLALGFPSHVAHVAGTYAKYNLLWPIPNGWYQCMRFYFQAQGKPRPAMYNNLIFLFINALLNWILVFGGPFPNFKGLGFIGAAISLSCSRTLQSIVYAWYMFAYKQHHLATWPESSTEDGGGGGSGGWLRHHTWHRTKEFLWQSIPQIGTLLFQTAANQAITVLVGRLGETAIAASSALSTITIPWSGTLSATCSTIGSVRVGYHMGKGHPHAARHTAYLVLYVITAVMIFVTIIWIPFKYEILKFATNDPQVVELAVAVIPALLVGTYLGLIVNTITSGIFSGMGRPVIATFLSFGFELPMSIGGVAIYILLFHGTVLSVVYWWNAMAAAIEMMVVVAILWWASDWDYWAAQAQQRQEALPSSSSNNNSDLESPQDEESPPAVVATSSKQTEGQTTNIVETTMTTTTKHLILVSLNPSTFEDGDSTTTPMGGNNVDDLS